LIKFTISEDIIKKCAEFGKASISSSSDKYAKRNQFDQEKIAKDIKIGKIGEEMVYEKLSPLFPELSKPDHNIYDKFNKSWDPDLKDLSGIKIAVKSQDFDSSTFFGDSWVFQFNKGKSYDCDKEIFGESKSLDQNYVAFVSLNVPRKTGIIQAIVKVSWLHENNMFKDMKKENLRGNKLAVYLDDLNTKKDELWQIKI